MSRNPLYGSSPPYATISHRQPEPDATILSLCLSALPLRILHTPNLLIGLTDRLNDLLIADCSQSASISTLDNDQTLYSLSFASVRRYSPSLLPSSTGKTSTTSSSASPLTLASPMLAALPQNSSTHQRAPLYSPHPHLQLHPSSPYFHPHPQSYFPQSPP